MWPKQSECKSFYGNPDANGDGSADPQWEHTNLMIIQCPWVLTLSWNPSGLTRKIRAHRRCASSLQSVLEKIWMSYGQDQKKIEEARLHLFGGSYQFRLKRRGNSLSMHSYGCALDFDPQVNYMGRPHIPGAGMVPCPTAVSSVIERPIGTVKSRLSRARAILNAELNVEIEHDHES